MNRQDTELRVAREAKGEAELVLEMVQEMDARDQKELLSFLRGVAFGQSISQRAV